MNYPTMPALPPPPPEEPRPSRNGKIVTVVGMSVVIALGVGIFAGTWIDGDATGVETSASGEPVTVDPVEQPEYTPEPEVTYSTPTAGDFTIELKVKGKQCFGSAGCNVTVEPEMTYDGPTSELDPAATYEVTYTISGDESGEIIQTLELSDQDSVEYSETMVSTTSSAVTPKAEVTDVEAW